MIEIKMGQVYYSKLIIFPESFSSQYINEKSRGWMRFFSDAGKERKEKEKNKIPPAARAGRIFHSIIALLH